MVIFLPIGLDGTTPLPNFWQDDVIQRQMFARVRGAIFQSCRAGCLSVSGNYARLLSRYRTLFGSGRVLCLTVEEFARDPAGVLTRLYRFVGHDASPPQTRSQNIKRAAVFQILQRQVNRLGMNELSPGRGLPLGNARRRFGGLSRHLNPKLTARIDARLERKMRRLIDRRFANSFAESNFRLSEMIGLDLARYGYQSRDIDANENSA